MVYQMWKYSAKAQGFHYWPPKFNSKDLAFIFVLELIVLFLSLKQEMDNNIFKKSTFGFSFGIWHKA